jgi:hypothetical protein
MKMVDTRREKACCGVGVSQSATEKQACQSVQRIATLGVGGPIRSDGRKTSNITKGFSEGLHLRWIFSG